MFKSMTQQGSQYQVTSLITYCQNAIVTYAKEQDKRYTGGYNIALLSDNKKISKPRRADLLRYHGLFEQYQSGGEQASVTLAEVLYADLQTIFTGFYVLGIKHRKFHYETNRSDLRKALFKVIDSFYPGLLLHCELTHRLPTVVQQENPRQLRNLRKLVDDFVPRIVAMKLENELSEIKATVGKSAPKPIDSRQTLKSSTTTGLTKSHEDLQADNTRLMLENFQLQEEIANLRANATIASPTLSSSPSYLSPSKYSY